ncbi:MAG TPA: class I SAM-dependent methyltransferase [Candidatus Polarisedimenticolaceae bacterium]|nr:class I SAM-dependent methyltransferase [Candidatus Polarisedimenticolaceae bacterium]
MVGFDDLYRQGGAVTWQAGKEDVVRQVVDLLMGLSPSARVLDFGCGTGWTAPILTASGARYLGVDPSSEGIAQAQKRSAGVPHARFHRIEMGQSLTDALHGAKFTHVFALDALYFVPNLESTLLALAEALEPGGLLCSISHIYRESRVADSLIDDVTREHGYPQFLSGVQWQLLLDRAGLKDVHRYRFYDRRPFNPAAFLGQPWSAIRLARELYEREGALVVTARH